MSYSIKVKRQSSPILGWVYVLFFSITFLFGDVFLQREIIYGINFFYVFLFISLMSFIIKFLFGKYDFLKSKIVKLFLIFFCVGMVYVVLSLFGFQAGLKMDGISISKQYIPRQAYWLFMIPVGIDIVDEFRRIKINKNTKIILILVDIVLVVLYQFNIFDPLTLWFIIPIICAAIYYLSKNTIYIFLFFISIALTFPEQVTYLIGDVIIFLFMILDFAISKWKLNKKNIYVIVKWSLPIIFIFGIIMLSLVSSRDPNTAWRLEYWKNDFEIIIRNYFVGVGFGTGYGSKSLLETINNPGVFLNQAPFPESSLYIAQHNSFVNVIYRLGLVGIILFILPLWKLFRTYFYQKHTQMLSFAFSIFLYGVLVIFLNPGLESPRFCLQFLFGIAVYGAVLLKNSDMEAENKAITNKIFSKIDRKKRELEY